MNSNIKQLEEKVISQIAAGEVVERPASLIKELVENALDAEANTIQVELNGGGLASIIVIDDGLGMSFVDLPLACQRHATSKIATIADLFAIHSLGFRGEALASIGAAARLVIKSKRAEDLSGSYYEYAHDEIIMHSYQACNKGTKIEVTELFARLPARKQFLKSLTKETNAVTLLMQKFALARADIAFRYLVDGRIVLQTRGKGNLQEAIAGVFGIGTAKNMYMVQTETKNLHLQGAISSASSYRSNRDQQYIYINGRQVNMVSLHRAFEQAYLEMLPLGKHPICVLNLMLPIENIDVNVHPHKLEIKLKNEYEVLQDFTQQIRQLLLAQKDSLQTREAYPPNIKMDYLTALKKANAVSYNYPNTLAFSENNLTQEQEKFDFQNFLATKAFSKLENDFSVQTEPGAEILVEEATQVIDKIIPSSELFFLELRIIGQFAQSYIIATYEDKLYLIDQHAAHERIAYEEIRKSYQGKSYTSQLLLLPVAIELAPDQKGKIIEHITTLERLGFVLELFGADTYLVRGVPAGFSWLEPQELLETTMSKLVLGIKHEEIFASWFHLYACKKAVKANHVLTLVEQKSLLEQLGSCEFPYTCPHGRPTLISFSKEEINRKFLRTN
ncbi:MAG: DNA mismatch repair endonuclease MutL [Clostridia bacterium]